MGIKRKLFNFIVKNLIRIFGFNKATRMSCGFSALFDPVFSIQTKEGQKYAFSCPNELTRLRVETYFTKEPETIEWIDTFSPGDTLFDIGANIGLYSIYAAKKGINVVSFEPESQNYALLNKNVYLNECQNKVTCFSLALSDEDRVDYLYLPSFLSGGAINCFGASLDEEGKNFVPAFKQGIVSYTLDSFLSRCKFFPNHIKIDVDGIEPKVLKGLEKTLHDSRLKSLLIELNELLPEHIQMIKEIQSKGWNLKHKKHAEIFNTGRYSKMYNYIFVR